MTHDNTKLAADLVDLLAEGVKAFSSSKAQQPVSAYLSKLQAATKKYLASTNIEEHKALVQCYLPYMDKVANQYILPTRYLHDINIFIKIIVSKNLVSYVTNELRADNTIAGVCMLRALLAQDTKWPHAKSCNITDVFKLWFGDSPPPDKLMGAQAVSDFLYGSGAWLLFQSEADNDFERIRYILKQGLPFTPSATPLQYETTAIGSSLPFDLS